MSQIYIYLARRDKKQIILLNVFSSGQNISATRINDIKSLNLPKNISDVIEEFVFEQRMLWEPWIESANGFAQLKESLIHRGYTNVPSYASPKFNSNSGEIYAQKPVDSKIVSGNFKNGIKTMLQKNKAF